MANIQMHYDWSHALAALYPKAQWSVSVDKNDNQTLNWMDESPRPNEADLEAWCVEKSRNEPMRLLRRERDKEMELCNWRIIKAISMGEELPSVWKNYLQALRDLPQNTNPDQIRMLEEDFKLIDRSSVNWPTPPEDHHYPITLKDLYKNTSSIFDY